MSAYINEIQGSAGNQAYSSNLNSLTTGYTQNPTSNSSPLNSGYNSNLDFGIKENPGLNNLEEEEESQLGSLVNESKSESKKENDKKGLQNPVQNSDLEKLFGNNNNKGIESSEIKKEDLNKKKEEEINFEEESFQKIRIKYKSGVGI